MLDFKTTINLEQQMIQAKEKTVKRILKEESDQEAFLSQVKNLLEDESRTDRALLERAGFKAAIDNAKSIKHENETLKATRNLLKNRRVFSLSEIKKVACDHGLRFLDTTLYKGSLPHDLAKDLKEAEELVSKEFNIPVAWSSFDHRYNTPTFKIMAPKTSFNLEAQPKDPLLFMALGNDRYYLVKKWGNDLSIGRKIANLPMRSWSSMWLTLFTLFTIASTAFCLKMHVPFLSSLLIVGATNVAGAFLSGMILFLMFEIEPNTETWNSKFRD